MSAKWVQSVVVLLLSGVAYPQGADRSARDEFDRIRQEYQAEQKAVMQKVMAVTDPVERELLVQKLRPDLGKYSKRFLDLALQKPGSELGYRCVDWILTSDRLGYYLAEAFDLVLKHYLEHGRLPSTLGVVMSVPGEHHADFFSSLKEKAPNRDVRAVAELGCARLLLVEREISLAVHSGNMRSKYVMGLYSDEYQEHLIGLDPIETVGAAIRLLEQVKAKYGDVAYRGGTMAKVIEGLLAELALAVGTPAPEIVGEDIAGKVFRLSDYRGKVVLLDFWGHW